MELNKDILLHQIEEAKKGKQAAFNYLLNKFWNEVYGFQLKRTQDEFEAEEVTIQTFSKAFGKLNQYDKTYQFNTWLITISKNLHIDLLRKKKDFHTIQSKQKEEKLNRIIDENPTAEDALITEQNLTELLGYIKRLQPHYQEMINLRYFQEQSYKEMAQTLDEPMNNVKVKLLRARRLLADLIQKDK